MEGNEDTTLIQGHFIPSLFQKRYQRNNKRGGLKNLRCFPECGLKHKERGFCGRPAFLRIICSESEVVEKLLFWAHFVPVSSKLAFKMGEQVNLSTIMQKERTKLTPLREWIKGTVLSDLSSHQQIEERMKRVLNQERRSITGKMCIDVAFNSELKGWHYGYVSNKHTCNSEHCLEAVVFEVSNSKDLKKLKELKKAEQRAFQIQRRKLKRPTKSWSASGDKSEHIESITKEVHMSCRAIIRSTSFQMFCRRRRRFQLKPTAPLSIPSQSRQKPPYTKCEVNKYANTNESDDHKEKQANEDKLSKQLAENEQTQKRQRAHSNIEVSKQHEANRMKEHNKDDTKYEAHSSNALESKASPSEALLLLGLQNPQT